MPTVVRLFLVAHSRDESGAGSRDFVRLFADGTEIASFGRPPGAGRAYTLEADSNIELDALRGSRLALGMRGPMPGRRGRPSCTARLIPGSLNTFPSPMRSHRAFLKPEVGG